NASYGQLLDEIPVEVSDEAGATGSIAGYSASPFLHISFTERRNFNEDLWYRTMNTQETPDLIITHCCIGMSDEALARLSSRDNIKRRIRVLRQHRKLPSVPNDPNFPNVGLAFQMEIQAPGKLGTRKFHFSTAILNSLSHFEKSMSTGKPTDLIITHCCIGMSNEALARLPSRDNIKNQRKRFVNSPLM
ncbi:unnamed protein product, partial [Didymodactylos carnosus]